MTTRILTLSGAGGCGKTRLARQLAIRLAAQSGEIGASYTDGVWVVELGDLHDPSLVTGTVARALGIRGDAHDPGSDLLISRLRTSHALIILDNCEHLSPACGDVVEVLLAACPEIHILVTSQRALGVSGEVVWQVLPLTVPRLESLGQGRPKEHLAEIVMSYEAVRLFVERALVADPTFVLSDRNALTVARICVRLDGLPLAIELAAARLRGATLEEIERQLDRRFEIPANDRGDVLPRHRTLAAMVSWSYHMLPLDERILFGWVAVFVGGFTLEAAKSVCCLGQRDGLADPVARDLAHLVDRSLVVAETRDGAVRFRLLETIRAYAWDLLTSMDEADEIRSLHARYYLALAERSTPELSGAPRRRWMDRMSAEIHNLRAALAWWMGRGDFANARRLALALWPFWFANGYLKEGSDYLISLARQVGDSIPAFQRGDLMVKTAMLIVTDQVEARRHFLEEGIAASRRAGDRSGIAASLKELGLIARDQHDLQMSRALLEECVATYREIGDRAGVSSALNGLATVVHGLGDREAAHRLHDESLLLARDVNDPVLLGWIFNDRGMLALEEGNLIRARSLFLESVILRRQAVTPHDLVYSIGTLAILAAAEAVRLQASESDPGQERARNQAALSLRLAGALDAQGEELGVHLAMMYRDKLADSLGKARQILPVDEAASAWAEGQRLSLDQALHDGLAEGKTATD